MGEATSVAVSGCGPLVNNASKESVDINETSVEANGRGSD
jgi:hypothetical protein